jgi:hypothetical protein
MIETIRKICYVTDDDGKSSWQTTEVPIHTVSPYYGDLLDIERSSAGWQDALARRNLVPMSIIGDTDYVKIVSKEQDQKVTKPVLRGFAPRPKTKRRW